MVVDPGWPARGYRTRSDRVGHGRRGRRPRQAPRRGPRPVPAPCSPACTRAGTARGEPVRTVGCVPLASALPSFAVTAAFPEFEAWFDVVRGGNWLALSALLAG